MMMMAQQQQQQQSTAAVPVSKQQGQRREYNHDRFFHQQQRHFLHNTQAQQQQLVQQQQQQQQQQERDHVYPMYHQHYQRNPVSFPRMTMMTPLATPRIANMMAAMSPHHYYQQQEQHHCTVTMPVLPDLQHHSQLQQQERRSPPVRKNSDVSSLPFPGSIVPDPHYNPEQDPLNDHRPFVPPLEIEVPTMPTICASTPAPLAQVKVALVHRYDQSHQQHQQEVYSPTETIVEGNTESSCLSPVVSSNDYSSHRPDWLQIEPHKKDKAKKKKTKKKKKQKPSNKTVENKKKGKGKKEDKPLSPRSPQSPCCISMELEQSASYIHHHSTRRVDDDDAAAADPPTDVPEDNRSTGSREVTDHGLNYTSYHHNPGLISPSSSGKGESRYMLHINTTSPTTKTAPTMISDNEKEEEDEYRAAPLESSDKRNEDGVTNSRPVLRYSWSPRSSNKKTPKTTGAKADAKDLLSQKGAGGGQQQQQQQAKQERKGMVRREFRRRYLWFRRGGRKATTTPRNNNDVSSDIVDDVRWSAPHSSPTFSASSSSSDSVSLTCSSGGARYGSQVV
eukprot:CAMPEP_0113482744 /NCGR_PEP_ID=MMETSP0014_2-20120614/23079_1 /TAXON_ID=2857 /ORGANISM="Nitzschia sp." /LENGTH=561 /DNA_ID=CAMNT_0000376275 /DNA_START=1032 /DNA_END=2717 /DNA_ORIENTATION=+ /assembly_acc=CAM_ASM_000159